MPIIQSAKKRMRQERKRTAANKMKKANLRVLLKKARRDKTTENLTSIFSALDKAAKTGLIHKNKASRLKSRLSKKTAQVNTKPAKKKTKKKVSKKIS